MELRFRELDHHYESIADPTKKWTSVTTVIGLYHEEFNQEDMAERCSKKKTSKWFGIPPFKIIEHWNRESDRANSMGTWYHNQRENEVGSCNTIRREGIDLPIHNPIFDGEYKISPAQTLISGIYPEHFMYLKSSGVCGQADRVEVIENKVDIYDYKTNKKIDLEGFTNYKGVTKKMYFPVNHLDDCNFMHYALQLSIYMYIILKHNPTLIPGKLIIHHISFEIEAEDEFGFPIPAVDLEGNPIVKAITPYEIPYLKNEVIALLNHLKFNPKVI